MALSCIFSYTDPTSSRESTSVRSGACLQGENTRRIVRSRLPKPFVRLGQSSTWSVVQSCTYFCHCHGWSQVLLSRCSVHAQWNGRSSVDPCVQVPRRMQIDSDNSVDSHQKDIVSEPSCGESEGTAHWVAGKNSSEANLMISVRGIRNGVGATSGWKPWRRWAPSLRPVVGGWGAI